MGNEEMQQVVRRRALAGARRGAAAALLVLSAFAVQGCSSYPDWANPVKWYDGVFGDEPTPAQQTASDQAPAANPPAADQNGAKEGFPNLATVPARPAAGTVGERRAMQQSLAADRDSAQYTDEDLRGRPASAAAVPPTAPPPPSATAAAPAPATPAPAEAAVTTAPVAPPPAAAQAAPAATQQQTATAVQQTTLAPPPAPAPRPSAQPAPAQPPLTAAMVAPQNAPPNLATSVDAVYKQALQQSAATVTTAPANAGFVPPRGQPVSQFSTAVPPIVQQNYNASLATPPPALPVNGAPAATGTGRAAFAAAGSRLAATIQFGDGSASLSADDRATLRSIAADYKQNGGTVRIVGYATDPNAAETVQQKLATFDIAERRAEAVASELVRLGARSNAVFVEAVTDAGMAREDNRRAEIFLEN
jgi:outer membrane protein OmpA-like peptidoglycan-associated protein